MKIKNVSFFAFRNVPDMEKEINGANILLVAENTKGKSNFIKGLRATLCGQLGPNAIRDGQDKAEVEVTLAEFENDQPIEGTDYTFKLTVKRDKEGEEKSTLQVTAPNGFKETKKTVIGTITGETTVPEGFVNLSLTDKGRKQQLEELKALMDKETLDHLKLWENKAQQAYDERTEVNRDIKRIEGYINTQGMDAALLEKYGEAPDVDVSALSTQLKAELDHNQLRKNVAERMEIRKTEISARAKDLVTLDEILVKAIEDCRIKKEQIIKESEDNVAKNLEAQAWITSNPEKPTAPVEAEIASAGETNKTIARAKALKTQLAELELHRERTGDLTALHDSSLQAIRDAIREMVFPIEGVTFEGETAYYNGKMIHPDQISQAEVMQLELRLLIAQRKAQDSVEGKNLADVLFIQRGESYGLHKLIELQQIVEKEGYQIIMEKVELGTEELQVNFMPKYVEPTKPESNA